MMDWKWGVIWNNLDTTIVQQPSYSKEEVFNSLYREWQLGEIQILGSSKYKGVAVLRPESEFVIDVHIFSDSENQWDVVKGFRNIANWIWSNTPYIKIEMRTHLTKVCALAKRLGFKEEGVRKRSFVTNNGTIIDEYEYGLVKPEVHNYV